MRTRRVLFIALLLWAFAVGYCQAATLFDCSWDDGTDELNTGGAAVWAGQNDANGLLSRIVTTTFNGSVGAMWVSGNSTARVQEDFTATATAAERNWLMVVAEGLSDGGSVPLVRFNYVGTSLAWIQFQQTADALYLQGRVRDSAGASQNIGDAIPISLNTGYQLELQYAAATLHGAAMKVWNSEGNSQVGSTQTFSGTTSSSSVTRIYAGLVADPLGGSTFAIVWDELKVINDAATWVGPIEVTPPAAGAVTGVIFW